VLFLIIENRTCPDLSFRNTLTLRSKVWILPKLTLTALYTNNVKYGCGEHCMFFSNHIVNMVYGFRFWEEIDPQALFFGRVCTYRQTHPVKSFTIHYRGLFKAWISNRYLRTEI